MNMSQDDKTVKYAKLEWYREVLALEPNSKLFLALARLLAELGSEENNAELVNEAFNVLRRGLDIHPDYMEARLFLIELLNMCGCKAQCGAEVARLASLFLSYPDFWDAWREYAITENESSDFTVALGFMSAIMRNKSLSIVHVLEAGLNALKTSSSPLFSEETLKLAKDVEQSSVGKMPAGGIEKIEACMHKITAADKNKPIVPNGAEQVLKQPSESAKADEFAENPTENLTEEFCAAENAENPDFVFDEETQKSGEQGLAESNDALENAQLPEHAELPDVKEEEESADDLSDVFPKSHLENYANFAEQQKQLQEKTKSTKETLAELIKDANITVEPMASSPFRTKSMADLLAEQGDYRGAFDIYKELLHKGYGSKSELEERIADLKMLAPELAVEIDKSKLLAIDDMVDTSFGIMAKSSEKNASPSAETDNGGIQSEHKAEETCIAAEDKETLADLPSAEPVLSDPILADDAAMLHREESVPTEAEDVQKEAVPDLFGDMQPVSSLEIDMPAEHAADLDLSDLNLSDLDLDVQKDKQAEKKEQYQEAVHVEGFSDVTAAENDINSPSDDLQEAGQSDTRPVSVKSHNDVADLLTKLAERLEIRAK